MNKTEDERLTSPAAETGCSAAADEAAGGCRLRVDFPSTTPTLKKGSARLIGALGTPLNDDDGLHVEGLARHIHEQWSAGIAGVLVGGTMGCMPLLRDSTYRDLVRRSVELYTGRGELMVGVGDTSFARTSDRIEYLNRFHVDGAVAMTPYFLPFSQGELTDYFIHLADISRNPLYLYDVPVRTGVKLELDTVETLSRHPNIRGIKCSCDLDWTRELIGRVGTRFRVMTVALDRMETFLAEGILNHLDGMFSLMPHWSAAIMRAADEADWIAVRRYVAKFQHLLKVMRGMGSFAVYTAIVRMRGIPGNFAPPPLRRLNADQLETLRNDPVIQE